MVKVAYFTNDSSLFGANRSLLNLVSSVSEDNVLPIIFTRYYGPLNKELDNRGIRTYIVKYNTDCASNPGKNLIKLSRFFLQQFKRNVLNTIALKKISKILINENVDLIHSNSAVVCIGFEASLKLNIRHVWHLREFIDLDHHLKPFIGWSKYLSKISSSDFVICISHSIANHFHLCKRFEIIYNAVCSLNSIPAKFPEKQNVFLMCASFTKNKGIDDAIKAFAKFSKRDFSLELWIAGSSTSDNDYFQYINKLIEQLGVTRSVKLLGYISDTKTLMMKAKALLVCSKNEAMGRVTAEAMLSNCLVIGYDNAGTSELLIHSKTGLLYKTQEQLLEGMTIAYDDECQSEYIRHNAFSYATGIFTEEKVRERILNVYSQFH